MPKRCFQASSEPYESFLIGEVLWRSSVNYSRIISDEEHLLHCRKIDIILGLNRTTNLDHTEVLRRVRLQEMLC
jgi:hypothetical protein